MNPVIRRTLRCGVPGTILLWICAALPLSADVTIRYQSTMKTEQAQPQLKEQMERFHAAMGESAMRMKNGKQWSHTGGMTFILDINKQQMTLIDAEHKTFSIIPANQFTERLAALIPNPPATSDAEKKNMPGIKTSMEVKKTGRSDTILGIQAEEREFIMSVEMSMPPMSGIEKPPMTIKNVMQIWTARPDDVLRNPAIRELTGYNLWANYFMNPAGIMEKMTSQHPGANGSFKSMIDELRKNNAVMLRLHMATYMSMPPRSAATAGAQDPNVPTFEMTNEAVELSSASVEDSIFQVPADYKEVASEELLKDMLQSQMKMLGPH